MSEDVDPAAVEHVADLARVDLSDTEVSTLVDDFEDILEYFEALEDVPEIEDDPDLVNVMRSDSITESLSREEALRNAPESEDGFFKGPPVG
jgi:aspartyl-tRNA(Asn)/glutamyl-tRNA(Gln) amidotransferase subunit C